MLALLPVTATAEPKPYSDEAAIRVALAHPVGRIAPEPPAAPRAASEEPFAARYRVRPYGPLWTKWTTVMADTARERELAAACRNAGTDCASEPARRFNAIVDSARMREGRARIGEVNRAVNLAIRAQPDLVQNGVIDRWTSPLATFESGRGDCEDYAFAKLALLQEAGLPAQDLRFVIVSEKRGLRQHHAVAAVRLDGRWLILDNRTFTLADAAALDVDPLFVMGGETGPAGPAAASAGSAASGDRPLLI
ncbi:MAG: transglutaminase-like cysteine peptidase [Pseudorhodoplanes sp.]